MIWFIVNSVLQMVPRLPSVVPLNTINRASLSDRLFLPLALPSIIHSKFLSEILSPIQNLNGHSVLNSSQFAKEVANVEISDDEVMVSFDVVSLFTAIPVNTKPVNTFGTNWTMTIHYTSEQVSTLMTSFLYWSLPFQIIILSIITVYSSRFMAVLWAVQLALSSPTSAWKWSRN